MNASQSSPRIGLAMLLCAVAGAATVATLALAARAPHPVAASSGGKIGFSGNPAQGGQTRNR